MVYLLVGPLKAPGMAPESLRFPDVTNLPTARDVFAGLGITWRRSPLNISFLLALVACVAVWVLIWRTRLGYEIRAFGQSEPAAVYAGISPVRITIVVMLISGALAGLMAVNTVMGQQERLLQENVQGAGFVGIAVALMGRSHPAGVFLAALLFGALYQGGGELEFEMPAVSREMILVIQALVILFTGALDGMVRRPVEALFARARRAGCWMRRRSCRSSNRPCGWRCRCCSPAWPACSRNGRGCSTSGWKARCWCRRSFRLQSPSPAATSGSG